MAYSFSIFYKKWELIHSVINVAGLFLCLAFGLKTIWLIGVALWFFVYLIQIPRFIDSVPMRIGYANWVTLLRIGIVLTLGFTYTHLGDIVLFIGFGFAMFSDLIDGYLARKYGQSSDAGELLDMEADAFMVLMLAWIHYDSGNVSWWILVPGGLRYIYTLTLFWLKDKKSDYPPKIVRATIAVLFYLSLLIPFLWVSEISKIILAVTSILIILSFSASVIQSIGMSIKNLNSG